MKFPIKENDVVTLATNMVTGLTTHAVDFPSVDTAALSSIVTNFYTARSNQVDSKSQAIIATENKDTALAQMIAAMKKALKQSEVDVTNTPDKITELGWKPKGSPSAPTVPAQPEDFIATNQNSGEITLTWTKAQTGGPIRNYFIEQRVKNDSGVFGSWSLVNFFYDTLVTLANQPVGHELEYRVTAANTVGQSLPSNTVAAVL